ncbi:MAG: two-component sensor histidine kinase [Proteobacteria bacterium]|nr:MAG: two-component sensor histidine kinase [Pseudomonadota bacterium]
MSRLRPNTLFARLVLTFTAGVLLTAVLTFLMQLPEREVFVFRISIYQAGHRIADLVKVLDQLSPEDRRRLARVAAGTNMRIAFQRKAPEAIKPEAGSLPAVLRDLVAEDLGKEWPLAVEVGHAQVAPEAAGGDLRDGYEFKVFAGLSDGSGVSFESREARRLPLWPRRVLNNMLLMLGVMALLSFFAVRWVTRPLHELARAAEELGRDINRPPLAESGPQEVRRAARAFNAMQERLSRYIRTRTSILTAMSHDLKTPITRLRLRAELLEQADLRDKFVRDLGDMESMVNGTLGYMRGLDDREPLRPIDIRAMVDAMQADSEELGSAIRVVGTALGPFRGKPEGLKRCLQNLIDNALRYGRDAEIAIEDSSQTLVVYVRDRGPGIPEDQLERVFEPFYRLESSRNLATGGTGLGLSIVRNIAQSMGGEVMLRNREGGGLEAKLVLPRSHRASPPASGTAEPAAFRAPSIERPVP